MGTLSAPRKLKILIWDIDETYKLHVCGPNVAVFSHTKRLKGREVKQFKDKGYLKVNIYGKPKSVHRLVAECAFGPCPTGLVVNHKDGNKLNNNPENLEYCTIGENIRHAINLGLHVASDPTRMPKYIDGRTFDKLAYKRSWYYKNHERNKARGRLYAETSRIKKGSK